jgi:hypothetical protein
MHALSPARSLTPPLASILLIGNFSDALPAPLCALSTLILVVACDYRECEWASPPPNFIFHRGCGRRLAVSQEWDLVIGSTDCTSIALCDTNAASRAKKLADGSAYWNAILPVWILCLRNAKRAAVELPRSLLDVWLVWPAETSNTDLWWYGAPWTKTTIWRTRGLRQLVPSAKALTPPEQGFPSLSHSSAFSDRRPPRLLHSSKTYYIFRYENHTQKEAAQQMEHSTCKTNTACKVQLIFINVESTCPT